MSRLDFADRALQDLKEIYDYIAEDDPLAAIRVINLIESRALTLADNPRTGTRRDELIASMRSAAEGNYVLFYFAASGGIEVARVLHAKRDVKKIFEGLQ